MQSQSSISSCIIVTGIAAMALLPIPTAFATNAQRSCRAEDAIDCCETGLFQL